MNNIKDILGIVATAISIFLFVANVIVVIAYKIKKAKGDKKEIAEAFSELPRLINEAEDLFKNEYKSGAKKLEFVLNGFYSLANNLAKLVKKEEVVEAVETILSTPEKKEIKNN